MRFLIHLISLVLVFIVGVTGSALGQAPDAGGAAPPPAAAPQRSAAELEKLVAPIALYPDPVIATLLPAAAYHGIEAPAIQWARRSRRITAPTFAQAA